MNRKDRELMAECKAALEYALPLLQKWCHYQGNDPKMHAEKLKPVTEMLAKLEQVE